jgi:hypothetical protein
MGRSHGFGSTSTYSFALFRLAFATAPLLQLNLARKRNSPVHSTKGTPSHINRAPTVCRHTVSGSFSLSVTREYLALGDGPPCFRRGFTCPALLRIRLGVATISTTGLLPSTMDLSRSLRLSSPFVTPCETSYNPGRQAFRFGLLPVRSPLLRESLLFSLPQGT